MWVNLSSTSTQGEIFDLGADVPEGWGMICDGYTIHLDDTKIEMDAGHLTVQKYDMRCEVLRENGDYSGEITVYINGSDSRINYQYTEELTWEKSAVNDELSGTVIASGAGGLILLVLLILAFIRKRDSDDDEDYIEDNYDEQDVPIAGPPATAFAGPPATTISSPSPMEEYQKQLDEYNRKMAEYQAWQDTQGSQVTNDSTHHE